jgi:raffinose/stachyose/melibiose transport system permease protein
VRNMKRNWRTIALLALPGLIVYSLVLPLPLVRTAIYSFQSYNVLEPAKWIGWTNYKAIFTTDPDFKRSLTNTFYLVGGSILLQIPIAFILAYWFGTGKVRGAKIFRNVFFFPVIVSGTAVGLLWNALLQPNIGLVDGFIRDLGFSHFNESWLASPNFAIWAVVVSISWQFFGYHMLIFSSGITSLPPGVIDAAQIDGAGEWRTLRSVVLPIMKPFLLVSLILIISSSVTIFANVISLTNGGPANDSQVVALQMYNDSFFYQRYGYGSALAMILLVLNIVLVGVVSGLFSGRLTAKGRARIRNSRPPKASRRNHPVAGLPGTPASATPASLANVGATVGAGPGMEIGTTSAMSSDNLGVES